MTRTDALELAVITATPGEPYGAILQRANEYLAFANSPVKRRPYPVAVAHKEGGDWQAWVKGDSTPVHTIRFSDGSMFDTYLGWRDDDD